MLAAGAAPLSSAAGRGVVPPSSGGTVRLLLGAAASDAREQPGAGLLPGMNAKYRCVSPDVLVNEDSWLSSLLALELVRLGSPGSVGSSLIVSCDVKPRQLVLFHRLRYLLKGWCFRHLSSSARVFKQAVSYPREL